MGGGTGTGAAPVIAKIAREMNILTVAIVTKPFGFEGVPRMENAEKGIIELNKYIDSLIIVPNDKLDRKNVVHAFEQADDVLKHAIKGIADLISKPCLINLDYADVCKIMRNRGYAHIGIGYGEGPGRALTAVKQAVKNELTDTTIYHATSMIISYQSGTFNTEEIDNATNLVRKVLQDDAEIIFGLDVVPDMGDQMTVTVIATGFKIAGSNRNEEQQYQPVPPVRQNVETYPRSSDTFDREAAQRIMTQRENSTVLEVSDDSNRIDVDEEMVPEFLSEMKDK